MAVDTSQYVGDFDLTKPAGTDPRSEGDDNFVQVKTATKQSFPSITGAVTKTHTEINDLAEKSTAQTISGDWTYTGDITLVNPVDEFSTDGTLAGDSDTALPTEKAVKTYVDGLAPQELGSSPLNTTGTTELGEITGIVSTCTEMIFYFDAVNITGTTDTIQIELGGSSGYATTSQGAYAWSNGAGGAGGIDFTGGPFEVAQDVSNLDLELTGTVRARLITGNKWVLDGVLDLGPATNGVVMCGGSVNLSAQTLDRVRVTTDGSQTFASGAVYVYANNR